MTCSALWHFCSRPVFKLTESPHDIIASFDATVRRSLPQSEMPELSASIGIDLAEGSVEGFVRTPNADICLFRIIVATAGLGPK